MSRHILRKHTSYEFGSVYRSSLRFNAFETTVKYNSARSCFRICVKCSSSEPPAEPCNDESSSARNSQTQTPTPPTPPNLNKTTETHASQPGQPTEHGRGPKLPERRPKKLATGLKPAPFQKATTTSILASYGVFTGLIGTLAVGTAWATGLNLAAMFHPEYLLLLSPSSSSSAILGTAGTLGALSNIPYDLQAAGGATVLLIGLNAFIMLPEYNTWALPKLNTDPGSSDRPLSTVSSKHEASVSLSPIALVSEKGSELNPASAISKDAASTSSSPPRSASTDEATQKSSQVSHLISQSSGNANMCVPHSSGSSYETPITTSHSPDHDTITAAESRSVIGIDTTAAQQLPEKVVPATSWGKQQQQGAMDSLRVMPMPVKRLKDALHLAQGHYTANNPTAGLNPGLELVSSAVSSLALELLYRGVGISLLTLWINDRLYEAGSEDIVVFPAWVSHIITPHAPLVMTMSTMDASRWGAVVLLVSLSVVLTFRRILQPPRPMSFVLDLRKDKDGKSNGTGGKVVDSPKLMPLASNTLAKSSAFSDVMTLTATIQGVRNTFQTAVLSFVFVVTGGNLAASYAASLTNQVAFALLQRYSAGRMRKRSASLAEELKEYNLQLRAIQKKKLQQQDEVNAAMSLSHSQADTDEPSLTEALMSSKIKLLAPEDINESKDDNKQMQEENSENIKRDIIGLLRPADSVDVKNASVTSDNLVSASAGHEVMTEFTDNGSFSQQVLSSGTTTHLETALADAPAAGSAVVDEHSGEQIPSTQISRALRALEMLVPDPGAKQGHGSRP
ncbi:hypothetical protein CEUSTIGMA_g9011.t1 [Chlamydomonas eustigma]|uniref:Uncharacterized protein n=1 Tax=Chlamydomonas eustigma TaxID=1157962 RepID=A0A250XEU8_9CHLO|nr:hypothetical protein CEUSTIGMA_g9011.t1 [Chlamydomonas eustigma]|eukprot:GAX81583.1 hypothetical protein CEUSTIGMA_g9011.t1 [Chlamydomonas eustigma]